VSDGRILCRTALAILLAACAMPQAARACSDGSQMRYYFLRQPPVITPDIMFVQVTIVSKTWTSVEARLEGPFARLSANGMIHIELPIEPQGTNCVDWGTLEGPVYVVASSALIRDGHASITAEPVKPNERSARRELQRLRRNARIYIDPSYLNPGKP